MTRYEQQEWTCLCRTCFYQIAGDYFCECTMLKEAKIVMNKVSIECKTIDCFGVIKCSKFEAK